MSLVDLILGRPLASSESEKQQLSVLTGVPVLGLDALASTGYGPEAALTALAPLGAAGLAYFPAITIAVVLQLATLYLSYRQTQAAYPDGGGAYVVAKTNLGEGAGTCAAAALLIDYLLNVCVAIASGVGAVVSAVPQLHAHTLTLCLVVLATLTLVNLRGVRESGLLFVLPVLVFILCMAAIIAVGLVQAWRSSGHPLPLVAPAPLSAPSARPSVWILFAAFANGLTAMTGVEAVSNAVPLFRPPTVRNAGRTLTVIAGLLAAFLLGVGYLCRAYGIGAMDESQPGYQTVLSQLAAAVAGHGVLYYVAVASIFVVMTYSAQTSFTDVPRVARLLARDRFLPLGFARRGRRLVFSRGVAALAVVSATILILFGGVTDRLIPLFAVGAFTAFLFSQAGMVLHWRHVGRRPQRGHLIYNALGALTTAVALIVIVAAKFVEGAWLVVVVGPLLVLGLWRIRRHYEEIGREIEAPLELRPGPHPPVRAVVPIEGWDRPAEKAIRFALALTEDVVALHVQTELDDERRLRSLWADKVERPAEAANVRPPRLEIVPSPYRRVYEPIVEFVRRQQTSASPLVAVIIPELAEANWFQALLHGIYAVGLKSLLYVRARESVVVIYVPWRLR